MRAYRVAVMLLCVAWGGAYGGEADRPASATVDREVAVEPEPTPARPLSFVLISVDTLNRNALRAYAPETAPALPHLDALAQASVRFDAAYATASWTLPSQASLLTGLYPDRHGATDERVTLAGDIPTLATLLSERGYQTVGFTDGGYLDERYGLSRGFDRFDTHVRFGVEWGIWLPRDGARMCIPGVGLFGRAVAFLLGREGDERPFFLFLQTYSVHDYFHVHSWATRALPPFDDKASYIDCQLGVATCTPEEWERAEALYTAELAHLDAGLGRLFEALDEVGARDETAIVFLSDHGEGFDLPRSRTHHGGRLHGDVLRIPLLVAIPGHAAGVRQDPVSLVDIMPSLLALAGAETPPELDGRALLPVERGATARTLFAMSHFYHWSGGKRTKVESVQARPIGTAVVADGHHYIRELRADGSVSQELYALADPGQDNELGASAEYAATLASLGALAAGRERDRPATAASELGEEVVEQLEALGYAR